MKIIKTSNGNTITLKITGRFDSVTSVQLFDVLKNNYSEGTSNLLIDLSELDFIVG
jgi:anti-anti-sigma regulatory factor